MGIKSADQITIIDVTDAYSVMLTSEAYTFVGETSGVGSGQSCTTEAVAFCGSNQCTVVSVNQSDIVCPTGITASVENSGTAKVKITFTTSATVSDSCEANIPVVVDGVTMNKKFSFAVAKTGTAGKGIKSVTRYYKLQSSTASAPAKPTANPPSGWTDSEPSYTSASMNTLYFCDLSVFSDDTYAYSTVSKSSTYEVTANTADGLEAAADAMENLSDEIGTRIEAAELAISKIDGLISTLVVDGNGGSLMEQTSDGWIFSMAEVLEKLQAATDDLKTLEDELDINGGNVESLQNVVDGLETLTSYIRISTDGDEPCLELGNTGSFKVLITNTAIKFIDGTSVPAYVTNQSLKIGKAEVEDELVFGGFVLKERSNGNVGLIWKGDDA